MTTAVAPRPPESLPPVLPSWRRAVLATLWITASATLVLWLHGGGLHGMAAGPAAALTSLGRFLGLVAAYLLLVQVVLIARIPALERTWGQDVLARWHRWVGFSSYNLVLAHIAAITLGYALT